MALSLQHRPLEISCDGLWARLCHQQSISCGRVHFASREQLVTLTRASFCTSGCHGLAMSTNLCDVVSARMAACTSRTNAANLPVSFVERIAQTYVCPSACFGSEFISAGPQTQQFQTRFLRWGRRLLTWPHGSSGVVVQGQLGWPDADTMRLSQAASLCSRLLSLPAHCCAGHIARYGCSQSCSWIQSVMAELQTGDVPHPQASRPRGLFAIVVPALVASRQISFVESCQC